LLERGGLNVFDAEVFRKARLQARLTYREVGVAAGLDPSTVAHCEAGRISPSPEAAERLSSGLRGLLIARLRAIVEVLPGH
jgi:transcriptional regulator with XRE-family HTH domain